MSNNNKAPKDSKPMSKTPKDDGAIKEPPGLSTQYDYVLDWIKESADYRRSQNALAERAIRAYQGKPSVNRYARTIKNYIEDVQRRDISRAKDLKKLLDDVPDKSSMVVHNAVETLVSMAMGGVGQYEFGPYDPDGNQDSRLMDKLSSAAQSFYRREKIDSLVPQYIRMAVLEGTAEFYVKQENGKKKVTIIESSRMIKDPKRFKTNCERFIGFHQRESFKAVKDRVRKTKGGGYILKTLNMSEVYVSQIKMELQSVTNTDATATYLHDEMRRDLDIFYKPIIQMIREKKKDDPDYMYDGDEIEISYLYDLMNDMYFEVINRRYIVLAKKNPLKREVDCRYVDADGKPKTKKKEVRLDHPFVELPMIKTFWDAYPISPLFYVLDDYDDLCAMESVLFHNLSIMAPISFIGQSSDAETVSRASMIAGEIIEGLPQTFGTLSKAHDITAVLTAVQRIEEKIKRTLKAVDPFEMQAMLGDRATAKEVVSAAGQVSQGINQFLANIETAFATLGDKFIKLEIIYGDGTYSFEHRGGYAELSDEEMAYDYEISAKLMTSIKLEQEANSRKAIELIQYMGQLPQINPKPFYGTTIPIVFGGLVNREKAESMVNPAYRPMPEEVMASIRKFAEQDAKRDPIDKMDLSGLSENDLDTAIYALSSGNDFDDSFMPVDPMVAMQDVDPVTGEPLQPSTAPVFDLEGQIDPSILAATGQQPTDTPVGNPEMGGMVANDPTGAGYGF